MHANAEPASAPPHAPPAIAALAVTLLVLSMFVPVLVAWRCAWSARRRLRMCPVCGGSAVRESSVELVGFTHTRTWLQCGQCATWRRVKTYRTDQQAHERRLARDRGRIRRRIEQLEADRRAGEVEAFIARLRSDIVGADDFLAGTRAPRPARHA